MQLFKYHIDRKLSAWKRITFHIPAETEQEANQLALQCKNAMDVCHPGKSLLNAPFPSGIKLMDSYTIADTVEHITLQMNMGNATVQILRGKEPNEPDDFDTEILVYDNLQGMFDS